jgi:hypothetical protein
LLHTLSNPVYILVIEYAGTEIATIEARDADSGDFGRITYLLDRISSQVLMNFAYISLVIEKNANFTDYFIDSIFFRENSKSIPRLEF